MILLKRDIRILAIRYITISQKQDIAKIGYQYIICNRIYVFVSE